MTPRTSLSLAPRGSVAGTSTTPPAEPGAQPLADDGASPRFTGGRTVESAWRRQDAITFPTITGALSEALRPFRHDDKIDRLANLPLLVHCTRSELKKLAGRSDEVEVEAGQSLVVEGWIGYWFFLIESGAAEVTHRGERVAELGPGEYFGEVAIIGLGPQPATVRALSDMKLFVVGRRDLLALIDDVPGLQRALFRSLARQLRVLGSAQWWSMSDPHRRPVVRSRRPSPVRPLVETLDEHRPLQTLAAGLMKPPPPEALAPAPRRPPNRRAQAAMAAFVLAALLAVGVGFHPPYVLVHPGRPFDAAADITIEGVATKPATGRYLVTPISYDQPNLLGFFVAHFRSEHNLIRITEPGTINDPAATRAEAREEFRRSQRIAAAAAAAALGLPVRTSGTGARIVTLADGSMAAQLLEVGDVIVAVDRKVVRVASDVAAAMAGKKSGAPTELRIDRDDGELVVVVAATRLPGPEQALGVAVETRDPSTELPFIVHFAERDVGGPSAGLAYALALVDLIDDADLADRRTIAATGSIDLSGEVGSVGFLREKARVASQARASMFLVPAAQVAEARRRSLATHGITSLRQALEELRARRAVRR